MRTILSLVPLPAPRAPGGDVWNPRRFEGADRRGPADRRRPERHGLCRGGRRAAGRGCVTAAGRAAAARDEAAAAFAAAASGRRASATAVAGAEASVTCRREGGGELLLFTFGSQHHQMVRAQERTSHDTPLPLPRFSSPVSELQRPRCSRVHPHFTDGETDPGEEAFPKTTPSRTVSSANG